MSRFEGRTEEPTPRRKRKARREGRIARSQEVGVALSLVGALLWVRVLAPGAARRLLEGTRVLLEASGGEPPGVAVRAAALDMAAASLVPLLAVAVTAAVVAGLMQTGFVLAPGAIVPRLSQLSPGQGLRRLRPSAMAWEGVRAVVKLGLLAALAWGPIRGILSEATQARTLGAWLVLLGSHIWTLLVRATLLATLAAGIDYAVNRFRTARSLRMTREELRREYKEMEGDPLIRSLRRRRHAEMSRNRMIAEVATADVLITNPVHLAVALRYTVGEPAPRVVAKGAGRLAVRLRKLAYRHGVLVKEDPALARAIYRRCQVGQFIPPALYEAVAVLIAVAYRRRRMGVM